MTRDLESKTEGEASVTGPFLLGAALSGTLLRLDHTPEELILSSLN